MEVCEWTVTGHSVQDVPHRRKNTTNVCINGYYFLKVVSFSLFFLGSPNVARDTAPFLPSAVSVRFPVRRCAGLPADAYPKFYISTVNLSSITLTQPDEPAYMGHPGKKVYYDDALALYSTISGPASNKTALDALANVTAQNYYDYRSVSYDVIYMGIVSPDLDATTDITEWSYTQEECQTRQRTESWNGDPEELHHNDPANAGCVDSPSGGGGTVVSERPCWDSFGPIAKLSGGSVLMPRYRNCLQDGRLSQTWIENEIIPCDCASGSACGSACITFNNRCTPVGGIASANFIITPFSGSPTASCVTDSTGKCCIPITSSGNYNWSVFGQNFNVTGSSFFSCTINNITPLSTTPQVCIRVFGCTPPLPNTIISVTLGGMAVTSGTTDSNGKVTLFLTSTGTYNYSATCVDPVFGFRYATVTGSFTVSTLGSIVPLTILMTAATGYVCVQSTSGSNTRFACPHPISKVLNGTIGGTAVTLTFDPTNYPNETEWWGTYTKASIGACGFSIVPPPCTGPEAITANVAFYLEFFVSSLVDPGKFILNVLNTPCLDGGGFPHWPSDKTFDITNVATDQFTSVTSWTCSPFDVSATISTMSNNTVLCLYGGGVIGTVTE